MIKYKLRLSNPLSILILFLSVLFLTILVNCLSIQNLSHPNFFQTQSKILFNDLPLAQAQTANPTPSSTKSPAPSPIQSPTPSPTESSSQSVTSDNKNTPDKPVQLDKNNILTLLMSVLIGTLLLLFAFLSPITGALGRNPSDETIKSKSDFLTGAFPSLLQGVTVIIIVMIVAILTLAGWIESQGTISILSALIGYVLGRKATELEYANPPSKIDSQQKPEALTINPPSAQVKYGEKIELKISPPQEVKVKIDPDLGKASQKNNSTIEYCAPTIAEAGGHKQVTITVKSENNQEAQTIVEFI